MNDVACPSSVACIATKQALWTAAPPCRSDMSRYKGRQSARSVEQDFPHFVDIAVPPGGLGKKLNAMYDFHAQHGIAPKRGQAE